EHVRLAHTEILRLVDADTGAAEQHDVIDARYSSRFLRRRSNQSRTVRMPDRCQVRIVVGVRCAKTINEGVIRRRPLFGTFGGHDVRVREHGRRIHAPELGRIIAEPHDRSARGIMEARVDSCVVRPLQIIASEVLVECRTEPGYVRCNVFGIVWISVGDDCPSRALIGDPEKEHLRLLRIRNSLCRVLFQGACDFFDSTEPGFSLLAVLTFQLRDQELKVLLVGLMAYRSRNSIQVADHVRITCQVLLALRIRKVVPPLLAVDWRLVERDLTPEVFVRSPTYGLHVSSSVRPRMLVHGEARSGLQFAQYIAIALIGLPGLTQCTHYAIGYLLSLRMMWVRMCQAGLTPATRLVEAILTAPGQPLASTPYETIASDDPAAGDRPVRPPILACCRVGNTAVRVDRVRQVLCIRQRALNRSLIGGKLCGQPRHRRANQPGLSFDVVVIGAQPLEPLDRRSG